MHYHILASEVNYRAGNVLSESGYEVRCVEVSTDIGFMETQFYSPSLSDFLIQMLPPAYFSFVLRTLNIHKDTSW